MQLNDWRLEFDFPVGEFISVPWNSTMTQSGTHYVIPPPGRAEPHHYARRLSHPRIPRRVDRRLFAAVELTDQRTVLHLSLE